MANKGKSAAWPLLAVLVGLIWVAQKVGIPTSDSAVPRPAAVPAAPAKAARSSPSLPTTSRIDACLESGDCVFQVHGAAAGPAKMSFWVLESRWREFTKADKDALRSRLDAYVVLMRQNAENYASNRQVGAGVPRNAPAFDLVVNNVRAAEGTVVFLSPRRSNSGGLVQGRVLTKF